jgi:hypothetical protein
MIAMLGINTVAVTNATSVHMTAPVFDAPLITRAARAQFLKVNAPGKEPWAGHRRSGIHAEPPRHSPQRRPQSFPRGWGRFFCQREQVT